MPALRIFIASAEEWAFVARTMKTSLDARKEFHVRDWQSSFSGGRTPVLDNVLRAIDDRDFGIFLLAPSEITRRVDPGQAEADEYLVARANVLIELGIFVGRHGRERVYVVSPGDETAEPGPFWMPSDIREQLAGSHLNFRGIRESKDDGGQVAQDDAKAAILSVVEDIVARFETVTQETFSRRPAPGVAFMEQRVVRESSWRQRYQRVAPGDLSAGDTVLHPLFGVGTFVEAQLIGGQPFALVTFADRARRVPNDEPLFDPFASGSRQT